MEGSRGRGENCSKFFKDVLDLLQRAGRGAELAYVIERWHSTPLYLILETKKANKKRREKPSSRSFCPALSLLLPSEERREVKREEERKSEGKEVKPLLVTSNKVL